MSIIMIPSRDMILRSVQNRVNATFHLLEIGLMNM
jgi:hypothetical protein